MLSNPFLLPKAHLISRTKATSKSCWHFDILDLQDFFDFDKVKNVANGTKVILGVDYQFRFSGHKKLKSRKDE